MSIEHKITYYVLAALMLFDGIALALMTAFGDPNKFTMRPIFAYPLLFLISGAYLGMAAFLYRRASK